MVDFDALAATWDADPERFRRAQRMADLIGSAIPLRRSTDALEYGAGTGLVALALLDSVGTITLADTSEGMLDVARKRAAEVGPRLRVRRLDLLAETAEPDSYDLIYTTLVLHHIGDVDLVLRRFHDALRPGGRVAIIDLDSDGGAYHAHHEHWDGHDGFARPAMAKALVEAGFADVRVTDGGITRRIVHHDGHEESREFSLFLAVGTKPAQA